MNKVVTITPKEICGEIDDLLMYRWRDHMQNQQHMQALLDAVDACDWCTWICGSVDNGVVVEYCRDTEEGVVRTTVCNFVRNHIPLPTGV